MRKRLNILLVLFLALALMLSSCSVKSGTDTWQDKIDKMLVSQSVSVNRVLICRLEGMTSSTAHLVRELDKGRVSSFVSLFSKEEITFTEQEGKIVIGNSPHYSICLINDGSEHKNDDGIVAKDDTGTGFAYAVSLFVDEKGYVYVNAGEALEKCYKSNLCVDINLLWDYYEKANIYREVIK